MARSGYIYLIYRLTETGYNRLISAHTVKREAKEWVSRSKFTPAEVLVMRVEDGVVGDRDEERDGGPYSYKPATIVNLE